MGTVTPKHLFSEWFAKHNHGDEDRDITVEIADISERVLLLDKTGTLDIKLSFERIADNAVGIKVTYKSKPPESPAIGMWFRGLDGSMTKDDPGALFHGDRNGESPNPVAEVAPRLVDGQVVDQSTGEIAKLPDDDGVVVQLPEVEEPF